MTMVLPKEERIELVLLSGREGWSQTLFFNMYPDFIVYYPGEILSHRIIIHCDLNRVYISLSESNLDCVCMTKYRKSEAKLY